MSDRGFFAGSAVLSVLSLILLVITLPYLTEGWFIVQVVICIIFSAATFASLIGMRMREEWTITLLLALFAALAINGLYLIAQYKVAPVVVMILVSILGLYFVASNARVYSIVPRKVVINS